MKKRFVVGVMGPGRVATEAETNLAFEVGMRVANTGMTLLTGGVAHGVMGWASRGAKQMDGEVIGVLPYPQPSETHPVSEHVTIPIVTNLGESRNFINVHSSDVIISIGMCPGTAIEVSFAVKLGKQIVLLASDQATRDFYAKTLQAKVTWFDHQRPSRIAELAVKHLERFRP